MKEVEYDGDSINCICPFRTPIGIGFPLCGNKCPHFECKKDYYMNATIIISCSGTPVTLIIKKKKKNSLHDEIVG